MNNPNNFGVQNGENQQSTGWDELSDVEFKPLEIPADKVAAIETSDAPMAEGRQDKRVDVVDSEGVEKRTSNLMLGYNEKGIQIGEKYLSVEDLEKRVADYLESDEDDVAFYVRKDDKEKRFCEPREVVDDIAKQLVESGSKIVLSKNEKVTNQDARNVEVNDENGETQTGMFMFGNTELRMPNGTYVSADIVEGALGNYLKAVQKEAAVAAPGEQAEQVPDEVQKVVKREKGGKRWIVPIALATAMMTTILSGIGSKDVVAKSSTDADFNLSTTVAQTEQVEMTPEEAYDKVLNDLLGVSTGETVEMADGVEYHESSDYANGGANKTGTFGESLRAPGEYTMEYISVLGADGEIKNVAYQEGQNLGEFVNETAEKEGVDPSELTILIHVGGPVSGWVNVADVVSKNIDITDPEALMKEIVVDSDEQFSGSAVDFDGTGSFLNEDGETVTVDFRLEDGTLVRPGEYVKGSDGREYRVDNLDVKTTESQETEASWSAVDSAKVATLASGAAAALGAIFVKDKGEKNGN